VVRDPYPAPRRKAQEEASVPNSYGSPCSRSYAAFPADYRRVLEESNLPIEVATAIADRLDGPSVPSEKIQNAAPQGGVAGDTTGARSSEIRATPEAGRDQPLHVPAVAAPDDKSNHPDTIRLRAWQSAFGTTQLTHAKARLDAAEKAAQSAKAPTASDILGAIARAWCHPKNSGKTLDPDLAFAIGAEINALVGNVDSGRD